MGDIAYHIFSRLSDKDLLSVASATSSLKSAYEKVDKNPQFWYERASALTDKLLVQRPGTEWKLIYTLLGNGVTDLNITSTPATEAIRSANTLRVLFEDLKISWDQSAALLIGSAEVLEYLLDTKKPSARLIRSIIITTAARDEGEAEKMLAAVSRNENSTEEMKREAVNAALFVGLTDKLSGLFGESWLTKTTSLTSGLLANKNSLEYLLQLHRPSKSNLLEAIGTAIIANKLVSLSILLDEADLTRAELSQLYASREGMLSAPVLQVLLDHGLVLTVSQWRALLVSSIRSGTVNLVELTLEHVNPMTATNQSLMLALRNGSDVVIKLLLSDHRIDPNVNRKTVLQSSIYLVHKLLIVRDPRVDIDELDEDELELVNKALRSNRLTYPTKYPQEEFFSPSSPYWFIARFLLVKQPTAEQTLEYIRDNLLQEKEVREAVLSIFDWYMDYSYEAAPIRALLLFLIYPNMTIEESELYLREDDEYPDELVDSSNFLIKLARR